MDDRYVLGVDPGFAFFGYALTRITATELFPEKMGVLRTKKSNAKSKVLSSDDNYRRCTELAVAMREVIEGKKIVALCGESMSFPRNASTAAKIAMSWGILCWATADLGIPMLQASPQRIKTGLCHKEKASKEDVKNALIKLYPSIDFDTLLEKYPAGQHEHAWDALSAVVTCLDAEPIRMVRRMLA